MTIKRYNAGSGHSYKIDGQKADGVTTLIKGGLPSPALMYWSARVVAEHVADNPDAVDSLRSLGRDPMVAALKATPWQTRDTLAVRGTHVHALGDQLLRGEEVDVPEHLAGHVESYVRFLDEWHAKPVLVETTVASRKWNYAGTLDFIIDLPDGRRVLGDIKTSTSGIFPETVLQLAAYRYAEVYLDPDGTEQDLAALNVTDTMAVQVRADGYDVFPLPADEKAFKTFLHVATVARWAKTAKTLIGDAAERPVWSGAA